MLVALVLLQQNMRRSTLQMSRHLVEDVPAHVIVGQSIKHQRHANATSSFPNTTEFLPENIKESRRPCGASKCLFENKYDDSIGWLVTKFSLPKRKRRTGKKSWREVHLKAWNYAMQLQQKYGAKHLYLEPPHNMTVSTQLNKILNHNLYSANGHKVNLKGRFREGSTVLVQKVAVAPKPSLFWGSWRVKLAPFKRKLPDLIAAIDDKDAFYANFQKGLEKLKDLVGKEPLLSNDFQAILDVQGNLHHIDLERIFDPMNEHQGNQPNDGEMDKTLKALDYIGRIVKDALAKS